MAVLLEIHGVAASLQMAGQALKFVLILGLVLVGLAAPARALSIMDLANVRGVQENEVSGMGIVVGLAGTGDKKNPERDRMIQAVIHNNGLDVSGQKIEAKNSALVMVTGRLPAFAATGQAIQFSVSAMADAKSLKGGTLLFTKLFYPDKDPMNASQEVPIYATAVGAVETPPGGPDSGGSVRGMVQREVPVTLVREGEVQLVLRAPNFVDADRIARQINQHFMNRVQENIASAADAGQVNVRVPEKFKDKTVSFIAELQQIPMLGGPTHAKVRINSKTGMVTFNELVEINPFAVSVKDLNLAVGGQQGPKAPPRGVIDFPRSTPPADPEAPPPPAKTTLQSLVEALTLMRVTPDELVEIIKEASKIGALQAELIVE